MRLFLVVLLAACAWAQEPAVTSVSIDGIVLGATRAAVDAVQADRGLQPEARGERMYYSGFHMGGPSVWFNAQGRCTKVDGVILHLDDHIYRCGSSDAKLISLLGKPDDIEVIQHSPSRVITVFSYQQWQLKAFFDGGYCVELCLGQEP